MATTERVVLDVKSAERWEQWLEANYDTATEVCFGWIDSLARGHDDVSRIQRFSPRKSKSAWSKSNVERVQRLLAAGRMREPGQRQIDAAKLDGRWPS
jgi:uncharacterized protein YdeI (YjbR/CyaY-like superfamily)